MSEWVIEKMAGHCGARLHGVSLENASHLALEQMRTALFEHGVIVMQTNTLA